MTNTRPRVPHTSRRSDALIRLSAVLLVLLGIGFAVVRFGGVSHLRRWAPTVREYLFGPQYNYKTPTDPDDVARLDEIKGVKPDIFGDLNEVLAVHTPRLRGHLLATMNDPALMLLVARSWGLTIHDLTGAAHEVEPFIEMLEQPMDLSVNDDDLNPTADKGEARTFSLWALAKAIASDAGFEEHYPGMRTVALQHIGYKSYREESLLILLLLRERGIADDDTNAAIEKALEHPLWRRLFESRYDEIKAFLVSGERDGE